MKPWLSCADVEKKMFCAEKARREVSRGAVRLVGKVPGVITLRASLK